MPLSVWLECQSATPIVWRIVVGSASGERLADHFCADAAGLSRRKRCTLVDLHRDEMIVDIGRDPQASG